MTATAVITGISDEQLAALQNGGWRDDRIGHPGWKRDVEVGDGRWMIQQVFPSHDGTWSCLCNGFDRRWQFDLTFDGALAWCDEQVGGCKPAKAGSATKQEDRFAQRAGGQS